MLLLELWAGGGRRLFDLSALEPHPRGYAFETWLREMFDLFGLAAREPIKHGGQGEGKPSGMRPDWSLHSAGLKERLENGRSYLSSIHLLQTK